MKFRNGKFEKNNDGSNLLELDVGKGVLNSGICVYIYTHEVQVPSGATLFDVTLFHSFSLKLYNDKSTIGLHCLVIHSMLGKYQDDWKSITIAS